MRNVFKKMTISTKKKDPSVSSPSPAGGNQQNASLSEQEEDHGSVPDSPNAAPPLPPRSASPKREIDLPYTPDEFREYITPFYAIHEPKKKKDEIDAVVKKYGSNGLLWIQVGLLRKYGTVMNLPGYEMHVRDEKIPPRVAQEAAQFLSANGPNVPFDVSSVWDGAGSSSSLVAETSFSSPSSTTKPTVMGMAAPENMYASKSNASHGYKDAATVLKSRGVGKYVAALEAMGIVAYNDLAKIQDDDPFWLTLPPFPDKKILKNIVMDARNAVASESGGDLEVSEVSAGDVSQQTEDESVVEHAPIPMFSTQPPQPPANLGNVLAAPPPPPKPQPPPPPTEKKHIAPPPPPKPAGVKPKTIVTPPPPPPPKPVAAISSSAAPTSSLVPPPVPSAAPVAAAAPAPAASTSSKPTPPPPVPVATAVVPTPPPVIVVAAVPSSSSTNNKSSAASKKVADLEKILEVKSLEAEKAIEEAERLAEAATLLADRLNAELRDHEQRLKTAKDELAALEKEEAQAAAVEAEEINEPPPAVPESPKEPPPDEPETPHEPPPSVPDDVLNEEEEQQHEKQYNQALPLDTQASSTSTSNFVPSTSFDEEEEELNQEVQEVEEAHQVDEKDSRTFSSPQATTTTNTLINELRHHPAPIKSTATHVGKQDTPCDNYVMDLTASTFSTCYCGHSKVAHGKSPQINSSSSNASGSGNDSNPFKNLPRTGSKRGSDLTPTPRTSGLGAPVPSSTTTVIDAHPQTTLEPIVETSNSGQHSAEPSPLSVPDTPSQPSTSENAITRFEAKSRLEAFYSVEQPEKLAQIEEILTKYEGKYEKMFTSLAKKYPGKFV